MFRDFYLSIIIGAGAIAPGLSGGTIAMIFRMYERIISAVSSFLVSPIKALKSLLPVGAGVVVGVVLFSTIQRALLDRYLMQTMFGFMGLILGSLPFLFREGNEKDPITKANLAGKAVPFLVALALGIALSLLDRQPIDVSPVSIEMNAFVFWGLFFGAVVLSASLVIPGISGTVLLVMIGQYGLVINALSELRNLLLLPVASPEMVERIADNLLVLVPLALGTAAGALLFSVFLNWLFKH